MFELIFILMAMIGAISLAYALLAFAADYALPYLARKPWQPSRRAQATYRRK